MRLALFRQLSKAQQKIETQKSLERIREAGRELDKLGIWHKQPKGFPKKVNEYTLWERKKDI